VHGLERSQLPHDLDKLDTDEKTHKETLFLQQSLFIMYEMISHRNNPPLYAVLQFQHTMDHTLLLLARKLFIDGEATHVSQVAELEATWKDLPGAKGSPYAFSFSAKEQKEMEADVEGAVRGMDAITSINETIGKLFPEQGVVRPELYDEALDALEQIKEQVIAIYAKTDKEREM
jgi:hypothetical protein